MEYDWWSISWRCAMFIRGQRVWSCLDREIDYVYVYYIALLILEIAKVWKVAYIRISRKKKINYLSSSNKTSHEKFQLLKEHQCWFRSNSYNHQFIWTYLQIYLKWYFLKFQSPSKKGLPLPLLKSNGQGPQLTFEKHTADKYHLNRGMLIHRIHL